MNGKEQISMLSRDPIGHVPLIFSQRAPDGRAYFVDNFGMPKISDFEIGPTDTHINAFIEYERTFGRGNANQFTHAHLYERLEGDVPKANILHAKRLGIAISDQEAGEAMAMYRTLAGKVRSTLVSENLDDVRALKKECAEFRKRFPQLYTDAGPRKKFVIKS